MVLWLAWWFDLIIRFISPNRHSTKVKTTRRQQQQQQPQQQQQQQQQQQPPPQQQQEEQEQEEQEEQEQEEQEEQEQEEQEEQEQANNTVARLVWATPRCGMYICWAWWISATHQALVKRLNCMSTAINWLHSGFKEKMQSSGLLKCRRWKPGKPCWNWSKTIQLKPPERIQEEIP